MTEHRDTATIRRERLAELKAKRQLNEVDVRRMAGIRQAMLRGGYADEAKPELSHIFAARHGFVPVFQRRHNNKPLSSLVRAIYDELRPGDRIVVHNRDDRVLADDEWDELPTLPPLHQQTEHRIWLVEVQVTKMLGGGRFDVTSPTGQAWRIDTPWRVVAAEPRLFDEDTAAELRAHALSRVARFPDIVDDLARRRLKMERLP